MDLQDTLRMARDYFARKEQIGRKAWDLLCEVKKQIEAGTPEEKAEIAYQIMHYLKNLKNPPRFLDSMLREHLDKLGFSEDFQGAGAKWDRKDPE